jgi:hypothetical protein
MNCKPGDLAVIVPGPPPHFQADLDLIGTIVKVTQVVTVRSDVLGQCGAQWAYEGRRLYCDGMEVLALSDLILRPIRDPGEDAKDETLLWLGSPHKETA